ncbi:GyrI-like domain-containing protein [Ampullimonas aquatilis]|uniref:GyrI-like domain-containing protein n=1 Tax=Ampullimonas aquatilis TaxID=1341549 RepID=UPI003C78A9EA
MKAPKLIYHPGFNALGYRVRTSNANEANPATARIPGLWQRFYEDKAPAILKANAENGHIVGVYSNYEKMYQGAYDVCAAVQMMQEQVLRPEMEVISVAAGEYLKFTEQGRLPGATIKAWQRIWEFFASNDQPLAEFYERAYTADFERYGEPDKVSVFVAVKRRIIRYDLPE